RCANRISSPASKRCRSKPERGPRPARPSTKGPSAVVVDLRVEPRPASLVLAFVALRLRDDGARCLMGARGAAPLEAAIARMAEEIGEVAAVGVVLAAAVAPFADVTVPADEVRHVAEIVACREERPGAV